MRTNAGRDHTARVLGDPSSNGTGNYAPACYLAVTEDDTAPGAGDTTLTDEITTGTLARALAAYAHVNGQATYTLTKTFTADQAVTLAKIGVFTASSGGTMVFETLLSSAAALDVDDQVAITETVTL